MRAREFVSRKIRENKTLAINIPISITVPADDKAPIIVQNPAQQPEEKTDIGTTNPVSLKQVVPNRQLHTEPTPQDNHPDEENGDPDVDVMVPPLQQEIELDKADAGKDSEVIDQLTQDEEDEDDENLPLAHR